MGTYFTGICYTMSGNTKIFEEEQWNGFTWSDINIKDKNYDDSINNISNNKCLYTTKCSEMYKIVNEETSYWCYSDYASVKNYCYFDKNTVKINLRYSYVPNYDINIPIYIEEKAYLLKNDFPLEIPYSEDVQNIHVYNKSINHSGRTLYKYTYSPSSIIPTEDKWLYVEQDFDVFEITYTVMEFNYNPELNTGKISFKVHTKNTLNHPFTSYNFYGDTASNQFIETKINVNYGVSVGSYSIDSTGIAKITLNDCYKGITINRSISSHSSHTDVIGPAIAIWFDNMPNGTKSRYFKKYKYGVTDPYRYMAIYIAKGFTEVSTKKDFLTTYDYS